MNNLMLEQTEKYPQFLPIKDEVHNVENHISYRKDIDGLRAIAIISVVIFHAWPTILPGGFIGVDVFFVISGYLITNIILKDNQQNNFSYLNFYNRRIRRIYPALILVLVFVLIVGISKFDKISLKIMSSTLVASTVFGANIQILLYNRSYFDPIAQRNPLLHLWSLGVEEQFYIIWPLLITIFTLKFNKQKFTLLAIFTGISFIACVILSFHNIRLDFYFPFFRFWQMAVGGLLNCEQINLSNRKIKEILSIIGLGLILASILIFNQNMLFPGWLALIPTLGSAFIISAGSQTFINENLLGSKPMIFVGKISYSLYLWHWPLLVLFKESYPLGSSSIFSNQFFIGFIAILISILSYYVIQNPFRKNKQKFVVFGLVLVMILIGATALYVNKHPDNFVQRLSDQQMKKYQLQVIPKQQDFYIKNGKKQANLSKNKNHHQPLSRYIKILSEIQDDSQLTFLYQKVSKQSKFYWENLNQKVFYEVANQGQQNLLLIVGDSHARFASYKLGKIYRDILKSNSKQKFPTIIYISLSGCILTPNDDGYEFIMQWIQKYKPDRIFFVYRWLRNWFNQNGKVDLRTGIKTANDKNYFNNVGHFHQIVKNLTQKSFDIVVSTINPQGKQFEPYYMYDQNGIIEQNIQPMKLSQFKSRNKAYIEFLQKGIVENGGKIIDFTDNQCWNDICNVLTPSGYPLYEDDNHFIATISQQWLTVVDHLIEF